MSALYILLFLPLPYSEMNNTCCCLAVWPCQSVHLWFRDWVNLSVCCLTSAIWFFLFVSCIDSLSMWFSRASTESVKQPNNQPASWPTDQPTNQPTTTNSNQPDLSNQTNPPTHLPGIGCICSTDVRKHPFRCLLKVTVFELMWSVVRKRKLDLRLFGGISFEVVSLQGVVPCPVVCHCWKHFWNSSFIVSYSVSFDFCWTSRMLYSVYLLCFDHGNKKSTGNLFWLGRGVGDHSHVFLVSYCCTERVVWVGALSWCSRQSPAHHFSLCWSLAASNRYSSTLAKVLVHSFTLWDKLVVNDPSRTKKHVQGGLDIWLNCLAVFSHGDEGLTAERTAALSLGHTDACLISCDDLWKEGHSFGTYSWRLQPTLTAAAFGHQSTHIAHILLWSISCLVLLSECSGMCLRKVPASLPSWMMRCLFWCFSSLTQHSHLLWLLLDALNIVHLQQWSASF